MWISVWKTLWITHKINSSEVGYMDIHRFIITFFERFPPFFAEKRYKLINFAPKLEIVDKLS